jgi:ribonuclease P protein component
VRAWRRVGAGQCWHGVAPRAARSCRPDTGRNLMGQPPLRNRRALRQPVPTLRKRAQFLRIRGGARWATSAFVVEGKPRDPVDSSPAAIGYTVTKQVGNAAVRNRVRRRLREAVRLCDRDLLVPGSDYVLIGRGAALQRRFALLMGDLEHALTQMRAGARQPGTRERGKPDAAGKAPSKAPQR